MLGIDYLGMGSKYWINKRSIDLTPAGLAIGCFDTTFGNVIPNLRVHLQSGKFLAVRVHIWWHNAHTIVPKLVLKDRLPKYEKLAQDFPNIRVYISHSCEHYEQNKKEVKKRMQLIENLAPSCTPVNAPSGKGAIVPGYITEYHQHDNPHAFPSPYIVSNDGEEIFKMDYAKYIQVHKNKAELVFLWGYPFNLRDVGEGKSVPPPKRTKVPKPKYIKSVINLIK